MRRQASAGVRMCESRAVIWPHRAPAHKARRPSLRATDHPGEGPQGAAMAAGNFDRLKALIVEDNGHMRSLLKSLLKALGLREVFEATDGDEGFYELHATRPDFVLSDLS